ncbi:NAD(P)/FAD-dependent oxidoreductase [Streptomyces griseoluteus]|uniref:NAD(P)/FAD-dependent oxidoreductase n=1 Tax=Streptomyces griseoluteus TaxID=29306 RepID=UPI0036878FC1
MPAPVKYGSEIERNLRSEANFAPRMPRLQGKGHLRKVRWRDNSRGELQVTPSSNAFLMLGAVPNTSWLTDCLETDEKGFIRVGHQVSDTSAFPSDGRPMELESSVPGVFAAGDVRSGSVKRVASSVGEGSIVVTAVHRALQLQR